MHIEKVFPQIRVLDFFLSHLSMSGPCGKINMQFSDLIIVTALKIILGEVPAVQCVESNPVSSEGYRDCSNLKSWIFNMFSPKDKQACSLLHVMCSQSESQVTETQRGFKKQYLLWTNDWPREVSQDFLCGIGMFVSEIWPCVVCCLMPRGCTPL